MYPLTWTRVGLFTLSIIPAFWFTWGLFQDDLWANPIEYITHQSGQLSLFFLVLTLMVKPVQELLGWFAPMSYRRQLGLFAAFYAVLHSLVYLGLDLGFYWDEIWLDILEHPYIWAGIVAVIVLIVLALTSTTGWRKRLKKTWQKIHNWVYIIPVLGVLHFVLLVKADYAEPILFGFMFVLLLSWRILSPEKRRKFKVL